MTTPAETLRSAARLLRERASAATPGPWRPVAALWQTETFAAVIGAEGVADNAETWLMATGRGAVSQEADAEYAATVHPLVGLALAGLLESLSGCGCEEGDDHWAEKSRALAIARLVLGEAEGAVTDEPELLTRGEAAALLPDHKAPGAEAAS